MQRMPARFTRLSWGWPATATRVGPPDNLSTRWPPKDFMLEHARVGVVAR
jgi:hypothetical protein